MPGPEPTTLIKQCPEPKWKISTHNEQLCAVNLNIQHRSWDLFTKVVYRNAVKRVHVKKESKQTLEDFRRLRRVHTTTSLSGCLWAQEEENNHQSLSAQTQNSFPTFKLILPVNVEITVRDNTSIQSLIEQSTCMQTNMRMYSNSYGIIAIDHSNSKDKNKG